MMAPFTGVIHCGQTATNADNNRGNERNQQRAFHG
jgi:hypothetical protein